MNITKDDIGKKVKTGDWGEGVIVDFLENDPYPIRVYFSYLHVYVAYGVEGRYDNSVNTLGRDLEWAEEKNNPKTTPVIPPLWVLTLPPMVKSRTSHVSHKDHKIITNSANGEFFKVCTDCKVEVNDNGEEV